MAHPTGSSTLPRPTTKASEADLIRSDKPATTASTTSLYDNVASGNQGQNQQGETCCGPTEALIEFFRLSRYAAATEIRHQHDDRASFRAAEPHRLANQPRRSERQAITSRRGDLQIRGNAGRRNVAAPKADRQDVRLHGYWHALERLQREHHA